MGIFDAVVCITLEDAHDRQNTFTRIFEGLSIPFEFYKAKRSEYGGRYGCFESHINVCRRAYDSGYKNVLIFEDDAIPTKGYDERLFKEVSDVMRRDNDWERIQLGYSIISNFNDYGALFRLLSSERVSSHIIRYHGCFTHAMCISRKGMKKILEAAPIELRKGGHIEHVDVWLNKTLSRDHQYCTIPIMFDQDWCIPTNNIPNSFLEKYIMRPNQCFLGKLPVLYYLPMIRYYRNEILIFLLLFFILLVIDVKMIKKNKNK